MTEEKIGKLPFKSAQIAPTTWLLLASLPPSITWK